MKLPFVHWLAIIATAGLLGWGGYLRWTEDDVSAEVTAYFANCRLAAEEIPHILPGGLFGKDVPVPTRAEDMLRPNVLISRSYESIGQGRAVGMLLVQTTDIANLLNHYPPACYPGQGWDIIGDEPAEWTVDGLDIRGTIYRMRPPGASEEQVVHIHNFMLQADGETSQDMDQLRSFARKGSGRDWGGGQVQVLFYGGMDEAERDAAFGDVIRGMKPALEAILDGNAG
ncbi:MAG: hypothetical protein AAGI46_02425 [Planctomycetota bacterium]